MFISRLILFREIKQSTVKNKLLIQLSLPVGGANFSMRSSYPDRNPSEAVH